MSGRHAHPMASRKRAREGQDREARRLAQLDADAARHAAPIDPTRMDGPWATGTGETSGLSDPGPAPRSKA